ncbi:MAG: Tar ligand binding domain-containing protein [Sulfuricella sp.]|nr:Tar ligand binding domain-containing protein [Sulfuricella sp.]
MKHNTPLSRRERQVPPGEILVSKTDLHGVITFANSVFAEVSGYALDELVGQSHNLVRHPDTPPQLFAELWETLKKGMPWRGVLKNRTKSGDYYWVDCFVMPIMDGGHIVGYQSVRRRAAAEDIAAAEKLYQALPAGTAAACAAGFRLDRLLSIRGGITLGIVYVALILTVGALLGMGIMREAEAELRAMYQNKVQAGDALARIKFLMADNRAQVLLALMHDPANPLSGSHDHPLSQHTEALNRSRGEIEQLWSTFRKREIGPVTAPLADRYWAARLRYVEEGLAPALQELDSGKFREANQLVGTRVNRLYDQANALADQLMQALLNEAEAGYAQELARHALIQRVMLAGMVIALLILAVSGLLFFRGIMVPLEQGIANLDQIVQGDLSCHVDICGGGEIGRFNRALAMTQAQLQIMNEETANGVTQVCTECNLLNSTVRRISDGIDVAHERIYQVVDRLTESTEAMARLSKQTEVVSLFAERSVTMAQTAGKEFSTLLMRLLEVADAVLHFREQLESVESQLAGYLAVPHTDNPPSPLALEKAVDAASEIRKVIASLSSLGVTFEKEKPWEMVQCSAQRVVEELGGEMAAMARELATETRIQSFSSEDAQLEMGKIALFLVETREAMHALWNASSNLSDLAASLENSSARFKMDGRST